MGLEEAGQQSCSPDGLSGHRAPLPLAVHEIQESRAKYRRVGIKWLFSRVKGTRA